MPSIRLINKFQQPKTRHGQSTPYVIAPPIFIASAGDFSSFFSDSTMLPKDGRSAGLLQKKISKC